jgi:hypothetical protein
MLRKLLGGFAVVLLAAPAVAQASINNTAELTGGTNGRVSAIVISNGIVYVGGSFSIAYDRAGHPFTRHNLAAFNANGTPTAWNPNANGAVHALAASGSRIFAAGAFTSIHGHSARRIAAIGLGGGWLWGGGAGGTVRTVKVANNRVFIGGSFRKVQGQRRNRLAALGPVHGTLTRWNPDADSTVYALAPLGSRIFVGGAFTTIGNHKAPHLVDLSQTTGARIRFASHPDYAVFGIALGSSNLYVAGAGAGGHIASYTFAGARRWFRVVDGAAAATVVAGKQVVFGGHFNNVCQGNTGGGSPFTCTTPISRRHLLSTTPGGALASWAPDVNSTLGVFAVRATKTRVWVGGDFTSVGPFTRRHLTRFTYR